MNDAIEHRVEQFVQEILSLVQSARDESRAAALHVVTAMLADMKQPAEPQTDAPPTSAPSATTRAKSARRPPRARAAGPATPRTPAPEAAPPPSPADPAIPSSATSSPAPARTSEREILVLDAARALGRATAAEIALRCGQPNGSVSVTLRGLVTRGLIAKTETARGIEYGLIPVGTRS